MRPALLAIPLIFSCGGSSAEKSSPPPETSAQGLWAPPTRKSPAPWPYVDCERKCGHGSTPDVVRSEPELDAVVAAPLLYKVVLENDEVRVLSATYEPSTKVPIHRHPDHVVFALESGKASFEPAGTHEVDVATATRALVVELGERPRSPRPDGDEPVAKYPRIFKLLLDEARVRVLDVTFGKGTSRPVALGDHVLLSRDKGTLVVTPKGSAAHTLDLQPGKVEFFPAGVYTATNARRESFEVVLFELK